MIIIDRFEGEFAVLEINGERNLEIEKSLLPETAKEGDVLELTINTEKTAERRREVLEMLKNL